jgi:hypothetical protein
MQDLDLDRDHAEETTNEHESEASEVNLAGKRRAHGLGSVSAVVPDGKNAGLHSCGFVSICGSTELFLLKRAGWRRLNSQRCGARFPLTVIQVEERARYLGALDQGWSRHSSACHAIAPMERRRKGATAEHAGQLLDLQTLVAGAVERSVDLAAGGK